MKERLKPFVGLLAGLLIGLFYFVRGSDVQEQKGFKFYHRQVLESVH